MTPTWEVMGPLIEEFHICLRNEGDKWIAYKRWVSVRPFSGDTALEAAHKCYEFIKRWD